MPVVNAAVEQWLMDQVSRGSKMESIVATMTQAGFGQDDALALARGAAAAHAAKNLRANGVNGVEATHGAYQYDPAPVATGNVIHAYDRDVQVLMRCERPQVVVFGDLLSADECAELIERARPRLKRSTTVNPQNGKEDIILDRTSEGMHFGLCEDAFIERVDRRIAGLMNWPVENGEGLQILHYNTAAEYRPHFDYFPPQQTGSASHTARSGQRVATLVVYLNDVPAGGETYFPTAGISVAGKQGGAAYFRYMNAQRQLDPLSLHGGAPVLAGEKWIMTKWMREHAYV
ncbi:2OG-Fe(II) oxygenase [Paraburkholderia fungorum]|jgi:prolyl 4-hydroxylase|nr:2OG-Fe(II) oxygenase [Paraburkholderia fungorum]MBB4512852.1 prolyl 4-hydroxylase [Paraburkholderia fungorum]